MSASCDYSELGELVFLCLSGEADRDQIAQLEARLANDEEARHYYGEFLVIYAGLRQSPANLLGSAAAEEVVSPPLKGAIRDVGQPRLHGSSDGVDTDLQPTRFTQQEATREIESYARRQLEAFLDQQRRQERLRQYERFDWDLAETAALAVQAMGRFVGTVVRAAKVGAVLAAIALIGLIVGLHIHANRVVARLTDSAEAVWETPPNDARLRCGWMRLEEGFAQIAFEKGAEVILQAPCEFELSSSNAMFLEDGKVTAHVPKSAAGFTVSTPTSRVVDFGTEFGLLTGSGRGDEVHVFDGSVRFKSSRRRRATRWDQPLRKGQAATADATGQVHVQALKDRPTQFVRVLPDANESGKPAGQLDLADIVGGGNGRGRGSAGRGIDPSTGAIVSTDTVSDGMGAGYIETPSLAFVDGVFVPDGGDGSVVISSTGTAFPECPDTSGKCYRTVINGAVFSCAPFARHPGRLKDQTYGTRERPSIGMHANAGITFDLENIRRSRPQLNVVAFRALCGVSETVADFTSESVALATTTDFWVLVDGQVPFSTTSGPMSPASEWIDVELAPTDRFLTLATTGSGTCTFAWGMFVEPTLELETR